MQKIIDYKLLNKAVKFFSKKGFTQIEVPWRVSKESINATFDVNLSFKSDDKFLIGSAEQGFLELIIQNKLRNTMAMSVSPCFRNDFEDSFHQKEFIKLELMYCSNHIIKETETIYNIFMSYVLKFITKKLKVHKSRITIMATNDSNSIYSEDILIDNIEYGSYGIRRFKDIYYIYGTGIALPRASTILNNSKGD